MNAILQPPMLYETQTYWTPQGCQVRETQYELPDFGRVDFDIELSCNEPRFERIVSRDFFSGCAD